MSENVMKRRRILLTGAKGFIGFHLYKFLTELDYDVIPADNCTGLGQHNRDLNIDGANWDLLTCDLPDVDVVIHLAAKAGVRESKKFPLKYWENNVHVTERIFKRYSNKAKILYASSSSAADMMSPYAMTKAVCELIAPPMAIGMRFFTVYGPKSRPDMLIRMLSEGKQFKTIARHTRDFTHVYDVIAGIECLLSNDVVGGVYDIGAGVPVKIIDVCKMFGQSPEEVDVVDESQTTCANPSFMHALGWEAKIKIQDGVKML
jgi:UDP-glucuronate 4-epimerase